MSPLSPIKSRPDLAALRARISQLERATVRPDKILPFGVAAIDAVLPGGGLMRAALHEVAGDGDGAAAATCFAAGILGRLEAPVLWCCSRDDLYPPGLSVSGLAARHVWYVRASKDQTVLMVMEEALRHPGLGAVLGEVGDISITASRRLSLAAEKSGVMAVILRRAPGEGTSAAATRWWIISKPSSVFEEAPQLIGRARWQVMLTRSRGGPSGEWLVEACDGAGYLALPAISDSRSGEQGAQHAA